MMRALLVASLLLSAPSLASAQSARSLSDRYVDALAGTWAATGVAVGSGGALGALGGLAVGCSVQRDVGCAAGALGGLAVGGALGFVIGPGPGVALGAGLDFLEALPVYGLGLASNLAVFGLSTLVGIAVDESGNTWGLGRAWGLMIGAGLGALTQAFLTPLYAVLLYEDRPRERQTAVLPFLAPAAGGATLGVAGSF